MVVHKSRKAGGKIHIDFFGQALNWKIREIIKMKQRKTETMT